MSATKNKLKAPSRASPVQQSQGSNSKKEKEGERRNDIKRKLFEQMQGGISRIPDGQAKSQENFENAKKLQKVIVSSFQQNIEALQLQLDKYARKDKNEQQKQQHQGVKIRCYSAQRDQSSGSIGGVNGGVGRENEMNSKSFNGEQGKQKQVKFLKTQPQHECAHKVGCPRDQKLNNSTQKQNGQVVRQVGDCMDKNENDCVRSPREDKERNKSPQSQSASNSGKKRIRQNLIESEEEKLEIMRKIEDQKKEIAGESCRKSGNGKNIKLTNQQKELSINKMKPPIPGSDESASSLKERAVVVNGKIKENSIRPRSSSSNSQINTNLQSSQRHKQQIQDLQYILERQQIENTQKLRGIEVRKLSEQLEKDAQFERSVLDIKQQQNQMKLLIQERDQTLERNNVLMKKCEQLQRELQLVNSNKDNLEEKLSNSSSTVRQLKGQLEQRQMEIDNLTKKQVLLLKMNQETETTHSKILASKQKNDEQISEKLQRFDGLNKQNIDLSIEFERRNKESQNQIATLLDRINELNKKSSQQAKNEGILEKKYKAELAIKEQLKIDLKMIQAQVSENEDLRNKLRIKEQKIEELDGVIDHLKRTIRGNLDIDMHATKNKPPIIERIIEKPVFIEKLVEIHRSQSSQSQEQQPTEMQKIREECAYWKNQSQQLEEKFDEFSRRDQDVINQKNQQIEVLNNKIESLISEIELLTHSNIDKNRKIANTLINHQHQHLHHTPELLQLPHNPPGQQYQLHNQSNFLNSTNNPPFFASSTNSYVPYSNHLS